MRSIKLIQILFIGCLSISLNAQHELKGTIIDEEGETLIGVTVKIDELSKGSSTDLSGNYSIKDIPNGTFTVTYSAIGFKTISQSIELTKNIVNNLTMVEDVLMLEEAVVIGYGTSRTKDLTGSAIAISEDK